MEQNQSKTNPFSESKLEDLLRTDENNCLLISENTTHEFKLTFDLKVKDNYLKPMVAMCNNEGGYVFFGVNDGTGEIIGLENFTAPDPVHINNNMNGIFSEIIKFETKSYKILAKDIFIIYVYPRTGIPVVSIGNFGKIKDGMIYYRYTAESKMANGNTLVKILQDISVNSIGNKQLENDKLNTRLKYEPNLKFRQSSLSGKMSQYVLFISNRGENATLESIEFDSPFIEVSPNITKEYTSEAEVPLLLYTNNLEEFTFNHAMRFRLTMIIKDKIGTKYKTMYNFPPTSTSFTMERIEE
jgi:hypothetical protein